MAISWLLLSLRTESAQDYIFACFFLICTSSLLKIRWLLGTLALTPPLLVVASAAAWNPAMSYVLPRDAEVHLTVAWATGGLMSYVADSYRRCGAVLPHEAHAHPAQPPGMTLTGVARPLLRLGYWCPCPGHERLLLLPWYARLESPWPPVCIHSHSSA